jgi:hypothetical protein
MSGMIKQIIERLHQPEYTGENRCEACTGVNLLISTAVSAVVARKSKLAGLLTFGASGALIYLRGYLIPGTPTITKRYFPEWVLQLFGKEPEPKTYSGIQVDNRLSDQAQGANTMQHDQSDSNSEPAQSTVEPEIYFVEHGILEPCEQDDDLCLTDEFESEWREEIKKNQYR